MEIQKKAKQEWEYWHAEKGEAGYKYWFSATQENEGFKLSSGCNDINYLGEYTSKLAEFASQVEKDTKGIK